MDFKLKPKNDGSSELIVELNQEELLRYFQVAKSRLGQVVAVDGFRKGKAPDSVLDNHLPEIQVRQTALEDAIQGSLARVLEEQKFDVAKTADLKVLDNTPDLLRYSVQLFLFPEVKLPDLATIKIAKQVAVVQNEEIAEALKVIQNMRATFSPKDATAENGDRVEVDFSVSLDGQVLDGGESKNHPLVIGGKGFMPGFEDALIGMQAGEEKKFSLTAPTDYFHKELAGKKLDFIVKLNRVQTVNLPEISDAFAQELGRFKDVEQLKLNVHQGILQEKQEKEQQRVRLAILEEIIKATTITAPAFLVTQELEVMVTNFDQELHSKGLELTMYLARMNKTLDSLRQDWTPEAERQAKIGLIIRAVAKEKSIEVVPEEIEQAFNEAVQSAVVQGGADVSQIDGQAARQRIADRLVREKTLNFIEGVCAVA